MQSNYPYPLPQPLQPEGDSIPYQLILWREWLNPDKKEVKKSEDIYTWFLHQIKLALPKWIQIVGGVEKRNNSELADKFMEEKGINKKIPLLLRDLWFQRNHNNKYPQYSLYYQKIRSHIIREIRKQKERQSKEIELDTLRKDRVLQEIPDVVNEILTNKSPLDKKIQLIRNLINALTKES